MSLVTSSSSSGDSVDPPSSSHFSNLVRTSRTMMTLKVKVDPTKMMKMKKTKEQQSEPAVYFDVESTRTSWAENDDDDCQIIVTDEEEEEQERIVEDDDDDDVMVVDVVKKDSSSGDDVAKKKGLCLDDFNLLSTIGKGGFGKVFLVQPRPSVLAHPSVHLDPSGFYALKTIRKSRLAANRTELKHTRNEHRAMQTAGDHPFVVKLISTFQSRSRIFFLTEYLAGGELFNLLTKRDLIPEDEARFYLAELVLALDFLHGRGIIYRDLKPENIMINHDGHLKLIDFGLARDGLTSEDAVNMTYCGTKEYMAPEVYRRQPYSRTADWWSLGAVAYDMMAGEFPYTAGDYDTPIHYPAKKFSSRARNFVKKLLKVDHKERLGNPNVGGVKSITKSSFFSDLSWNDVFLKRLKPPFVPDLEAPNSVRYFDRDFLSLPAHLSTSDSGDGDFGHFNDFAYVHPDNQRPESEPGR